MLGLAPGRLVWAAFGIVWRPVCFRGGHREHPNKPPYRRDLLLFQFPGDPLLVCSRCFLVLVPFGAARPACTSNLGPLWARLVKMTTQSSVQTTLICAEHLVKSLREQTDHPTNLTNCPQHPSGTIGQRKLNKFKISTSELVCVMVGSVCVLCGSDSCQLSSKGAQDRGTHHDRE